MQEHDFAKYRRRVSRAIGAEIRAARISADLTQEDVAHQAGLSVQTYASLERGYSSTGAGTNPTLDTLLRVLTTLGIEDPE